MSCLCEASSFPSRTCITGLVLQHCCKTRCRSFVVHFSVSSLSFKFSQECSPLQVYINLTFTLYLAPWALLSSLLLLNLSKRFIKKHGHGWLSCSVLGRRVAELELYILVCKVCVVGVFMRNVSLSDPFKYFSRTLDLVFRTTRTRGRELIAFLYVRLLHAFFFPRLARRFVKAVSLHGCQWSNSFKFYQGEKKFPCHLLTTNKIEGERGRVLIQGGHSGGTLIC